MEHAMHCFARLVRALLGSKALAEKKLECGASLVVLGVCMSMTDLGFSVRPAKDKANKCIATINEALKTGVLMPGCAEKLAGRLSWAAQFLFYRVGRAMLRPIFDQRKVGNGLSFSLITCDMLCCAMWCIRAGRVGVTLETAMLWWLHVLVSDVCEEHPWEPPASPVARMFVDAASNPARCAAVLFCESGCLYTDGKPCKMLLDRLATRKDNQIMGLESIAIALGLSTFAPELHQRKVVVYSDNKGAEAATRKGAAKAWDHCQVIHEVWTQALVNHTYLWIERVPSDDNLSDLPSRGEHALLAGRLGAQWRKPVIAPLFLDVVLGCAQSR